MITFTHHARAFLLLKATFHRAQSQQPKPWAIYTENKETTTTIRVETKSSRESVWGPDLDSVIFEHAIVYAGLYEIPPSGI
jgi:hypothetical protein